MGIYAAVAEAIDAYTGLSPAAFFTILALMVGAYRLVCAMFVPPNEDHVVPAPMPMTMAAPPEPVQMGDVTLEELRVFDGSDPAKPLLMAVKGQIYDVSRSRMFYGPGGPYALFAGREASRALALMSFDPNDLTGNLEGLSTAELEVLQDWEEKFKEKYAKVGQLVSAKLKNEDGNQSIEKTKEIEEAPINTEDVNKDAET